MTLEKSIEKSKILLKKLKENLKGAGLILEPIDFINLLNDGAKEARLNKEYKAGTETRYIHYAIYEGVLIQTNTSTEINDLEA